MTLASTATQTAGSTGNGATVEFSFSFRIQAYGDVAAADQIEVVRVTIASAAEVVLTKTTDYTVSINADQDASPGGAITMLVAPSSAYKIYIRRAPSYLQPVDLQAQGAFSAPVIESAFDQVVMQVQDLRARQMRSPFGGLQTPSGFNGEISGVPAAGYTIVVNQDEDGYIFATPASVAVTPAMTPVVQAATTILGFVALGVPTSFATALDGLSEGASLPDVAEALELDDYGDARWASLEENNEFEGTQTAPSFTATEADNNATLRTLRTGTTTVDARMRSGAAQTQFGSWTNHPMEFVINGSKVGEIKTNGSPAFKGTPTNDDAASGDIGESISSSVEVGSAVSLTTGTSANVTSISLTAGDWDVWGNVCYSLNAATTLSRLFAAISTTSATLPTAPNAGAVTRLALTFTTGENQFISAGSRRIVLTSTTTVYLVANAVFGVNTCAAFGYIQARRRR